jgi:hypothetical protein
VGGRGIPDHVPQFQAEPVSRGRCGAGGHCHVRSRQQDLTGGEEVRPGRARSDAVKQSEPSPITPDEWSDPIRFNAPALHTPTLQAAGRTSRIPCVAEPERQRELTMNEIDERVARDGFDRIADEHVSGIAVAPLAAWIVAIEMRATIATASAARTSFLCTEGVSATSRFSEGLSVPTEAIRPCASVSRPRSLEVEFSQHPTALTRNDERSGHPVYCCIITDIAEI